MRLYNHYEDTTTALSERPKPENTSNVLNLSSKTLTETQHNLLSKGLNFTPTPKNIDNFEVISEFQEFALRLRLREFFHNKTTNVNDIGTPFKEKSTWSPPVNREPHLESFITAIENDVIQAINSNIKVRNNLSYNEHAALISLKHGNDIIIKQADKGGVIVIQDKSDYINEAYRHLNDINYCKKVDWDPTPEFLKIIEDKLCSLQKNQHIRRETLQFFSPKHPVPGRFYMLPKIHKPINPGRPIISNCGMPTENLPAYVDHHMKDFPQCLTSYIKDTTHFLNMISDINNNGKLPPNTILCTMDVSSLYVNIPHDEGLKAFESSLLKLDKPNTRTIVDLTKLVLTLNGFEFNNEFYTQTKGTAMGTKIAPN
ncbi:uncharacterized protein LOC106459805 [Limulus polyphemus]|uniref:Uncharacterized protein LOC106459805 n=1 Tax=Limulus polyphemus TaxID=6850 RepID=A0ABM1B4Y6_LIMPO|nr:uncharacterized protein LOC106459805 [Limulus polyphemus]